jgi:hypothetical protein
VGRHAGPAQRPPWPRELVGWGAFAVLVGALAVLWFYRSWVGALLVAALGALALAAVVALAVSGARRSARRP